MQDSITSQGDHDRDDDDNDDKDDDNDDDDDDNHDGDDEHNQNDDKLLFNFSTCRVMDSSIFFPMNWTFQLNCDRIR